MAIGGCWWRGLGLRGGGLGKRGRGRGEERLNYGRRAGCGFGVGGGGEVGLIEGVEGEGEMMVGVFSSFFICHLRLMSL